MMYDTFFLLRNAREAKKNETISFWTEKFPLHFETNRKRFKKLPKYCLVTRFKNNHR